MIQTLERTVEASRLRGIIDLPEAIDTQTVTVVVCFELPERTSTEQTEPQQAAQSAEIAERRAALADFEKLRGCLPADFDYKKERDSYIEAQGGIK
jgi:hypothetical protein